MAVADSIAGRIGAGLWRTNPLLSIGIAGGLGAGAYAGAHTFAASDGSIGERSEAAGKSASRYALGGVLGLGALSVVANPALGITGGIGKAAGRFTGSIPNRARKYRWDVTGSYNKGAVRARNEVLEGEFGVGRQAAEGPLSKAATSAMHWEGMQGGAMEVMEKQKGLMIGAGAGIGALIGSKLDKDDPRRGAMKGAVVGGGAGLAISHGIRASRVWNKFGAVGKGGAIGALSLLAFGATTAVARPKYASVDVAQREDYGMHDRMNAIGATGDVVLGLHNAR